MPIPSAQEVGNSYTGYGTLVSLSEVIIWCQISCQSEPLLKCLLVDRLHGKNLKSEVRRRCTHSHELLSENQATNWYEIGLTSLEKDALRELPLNKDLTELWKPLPHTRTTITKRLPVEKTPGLMPPAPSTRIPRPSYPQWPGGQSWPPLGEALRNMDATHLV